MVSLTTAPAVAGSAEQASTTARLAGSRSLRIRFEPEPDRPTKCVVSKC